MMRMTTADRQQLQRQQRIVQLRQLLQVVTTMMMVMIAEDRQQLQRQQVLDRQRVQLQVQVLDASGHTVREASAPMTDVPAGGRGSFRLPLPDAGARYVVTVHAFEFGSGESP